MKIAMYRNYLRHIGHPVYGFVRDVAYDRVNLIIPDEWLYGYNAAGNPIFVMPDGTKNIMSNLLVDQYGKPYFIDNSMHRYYIDVEEIE